VVRVPALGLLPREVLRVLLLVEGGDVVDGGGLLGTGPLGGRVGVQRAEPPREVRVLVLVDELVAEEHDLVLEDGGLDLFPVGVAQRVPEVYAADLGTDRGLKRADGERGVPGLRLGRRGHGGS
jgi:hypothetical protein